jgi:alkylated DNA repair protein (DNA oxidative demethylase)
MTAAGSTPDLFGSMALPLPARETLAPDAVLLRGFADPDAQRLAGSLHAVVAQAPWRHMQTPGGLRMSAAMTNCGTAGWVSDRRGYRYSTTDPLSDRSWPTMPEAFRALAVRAAAAAGYCDFDPDACLINRYVPGASMSLHQDRNERDNAAPIVSVSLGLPAVFLFGGARRSDRANRVALGHGDIVIWGGASRLNFHGIARIKPGSHPFAGECRINLTFRKAL